MARKRTMVQHSATQVCRPYGCLSTNSPVEHRESRRRVSASAREGSPSHDRYVHSGESPPRKTDERNNHSTYIHPFRFLRSFSVWPIIYPYHRVLTGDALLPIAELPRTAAAHQAVSPVRETLVNFFALLFKRYLVSPQKKFKVRQHDASSQLR